MLLLVLIYFNSIKVQLELTLSLKHLMIDTNFNSIKVQLEPFSRKRVKALDCKFQFHKGTIRTR